ncbi:choline/ethanolamine kinase family protein [Muribacter muris]|nr:choline/ethanolamine kinase family protein [Muribacter muris]
MVASSTEYSVALDKTYRGKCELPHLSAWAALMPLDWLTQTRRQAVRSVENLPGLSACSQCVELTNGERYVLRHQTARASRCGIDYRQEAHLLSQIAPLGFSPKPLCHTENASLLSWIEGQTATEFSPTLLKMLAYRLATLYTFDVQAEKGSEALIPFDLAQRCQFFWQQLAPDVRQKLPFSPPFPTISPFKRAICHHDLHLQNIVLNHGELFLIDWEYAALSDPALDIALFFAANPLNATQQAIFLRHYFAKTGFEPTAFRRKMAQYAQEVPKLSQLWFLL